MRPSHRVPMPSLDRMLREANFLLENNGLPQCLFLEPMTDQDTNNPTVIGRAENRRYVIKACFRNAHFFERAQRMANLIAKCTGLPIPKHLCYASEADSLPLMIMEWMPGEQLRLVLPSLPTEKAEELAADWGHCIARFHLAPIESDDCPDLPEPEEGYTGFVEWLRGAAQ